MRVAPISWLNCDPDHTAATFFVGTWGEYRISAMRTAFAAWASRTRAPAFRRVFAQLCADRSGRSGLSYAENRGPADGQSGYRTIHQEDRSRSFRAPAISDHYEDICLVFGIPRQMTASMRFLTVHCLEPEDRVRVDSACLTARWAAAKRKIRGEP